MSEKPRETATTNQLLGVYFALLLVTALYGMAVLTNVHGVKDQLRDICRAEYPRCVVEEKP